MIRRLLRRLIKWALAEPEAQPKESSIAGFKIVVNPAIAEDLIICSASMESERRAVIKHFRKAELNREI